MPESDTIKQPLTQDDNPLPSIFGYYAGFVSRFMAFIIDILLLAVVITIASLLVNQLLDVIGSIRSLIFDGTIISKLNLRLPLSVITLILCYTIYFVFFWSFLGTTIGGFIIGIRLVNKKGRRPSIIQAIFRFIIEFMIPIFLIFGSLWILIDRRKQAWYDKLAGTYVIYSWAAKPEERFVRRGMIEGYKLDEPSNEKK
jgi:uncharacterized RDD family membrane protein YckC